MICAALLLPGTNSAVNKKWCWLPRTKSLHNCVSSCRSMKVKHVPLTLLHYTRPHRILNFNSMVSTADVAKAKQIQDAATEINAAKAEAERLREQLAQKEDTLRDLQSANTSLATSLAEKDEQLKAEEIALVSLQQELERHIYEDTIVDGDILRKFRIPETV